MSNIFIRFSVILRICCYSLSSVIVKLHLVGQKKPSENISYGSGKLWWGFFELTLKISWLMRNKVIFSWSPLVFCVQKMTLNKMFLWTGQTGCERQRWATHFISCPSERDTQIQIYEEDTRRGDVNGCAGKQIPRRLIGEKKGRQTDNHT